jgi:endonuclease/exonuclease/phosphatase family metal-dependent hydrolase
MKLLSVWLGAMAWLALAGASASAYAQHELHVMSFNIRYGSADDGPNHWDLRKDFLASVVAEVSPDVIGLQEALHHQIEFLLGRLPEYAMLGVGRDDGKRAGEYTAILYRRDRLTVEDSGTFWFSDTPEVPGSTSWGNTITRICTWARFRTASGAPIYVYNLHLDHRSQPSREKSVALLRQRIEARTPKAPFIVTGDFNAGESNPVIAAMTAGGFVRDSFRVLHPDASPAGTFTSFRLGNVETEKIDYVFVSEGIEVLEADIIRTSRDGRYPSDHFPVTARVRWR